MAIRTEENSEDKFIELKKVSDYRTFLKSYLQLFDYSLSDFARATGFGRGFPGEVISGKRRLTTKSSHVFEKALKLPIKGKKLFRSLVALEESDTYPDIDRSRLNQDIVFLREQPWLRGRTIIQEEQSSFSSEKDLVIDKKALSVYAACGDFIRGASFSEIEERTAYSKQDISKYITELERMGLIEVKDSLNVLPKDLHLFLQTCDQSKLLTHSFRQSADLASKRVGDLRDQSNEFFFNSSFCIDKEKLPQLKEELRETILKFIDSSIEAQGDRIANLILALHL